MQKNAEFWIKKYDMQPHPEGGFYAEMFRADLRVDAVMGNRSALTSIFYLLENEDFSGFHKIKSPELWYFHAGTELHIHELRTDGSAKKHVLNAENPFVAIAPESWFASEVSQQKGYVLVSCAVAPGFEFEDFEMARKENLLPIYPSEEFNIKRLSR